MAIGKAELRNGVDIAPIHVAEPSYSLRSPVPSLRVMQAFVSHLNSDQKSRLRDLLFTFRSSFDVLTRYLGKTNSFSRTIQTPEEEIVRHRPHRVSPSERHTINKEVTNTLEKRRHSTIIQPVFLSRYPCHKDGDVRVCLDDRRFHVRSRKDVDPLPPN